MDQLGSWVDELEEWVAAFEPGVLDGGQAVALVALAARGERLFAAVRLQAVGRVAETGEWQRGGSRSAADWLARQTKSDAHKAAVALEVAGALDECPGVKAEVVRGRLSEAQAHLILDAVAARPDAEGPLIEYAHGHSVRQLGEECRRVKTSASDAADAAEKLHRQRSYRSWTGRDGSFCFMGRGTPEVGALFQAAVEAETARLARAARVDGHREPFEALAFDAVTNLVTENRGEGSGTGTAATRPQASVYVHVDYEALMRGWVEGEELCEIRGVGPVPVTVARELLADSVLYVLVKRGAVPYAVTPGVRTVSKAVRTFVEARDRGCVVPGCDQTRGLELHHVAVDFARGGLRNKENLVNTCKRHHAMITYGGWRLAGTHGAWEFQPPSCDWEPDPEPGPDVPYWRSPWVARPDELALAGR